MKLTGKVSLISACGRGIGKEIALTLARAGSDVVINSFSEENTQALANEIEALGVKVVAVAGDVTTSVVILEMVAAAIDAFGKIDIVVNNVGGGSAGDIDDKDNPLAEVEAIWARIDQADDWSAFHAKIDAILGERRARGLL